MRPARATPSRNCCDRPSIRTADGSTGIRRPQNSVRYSSRDSYGGATGLPAMGSAAGNGALRRFRCVTAVAARRAATSPRESCGFQRGAAGNGALRRFRCVIAVASRRVATSRCGTSGSQHRAAGNDALRRFRCVISCNSKRACCGSKAPQQVLSSCRSYIRCVSTMLKSSQASSPTLNTRRPTGWLSVMRTSRSPTMTW